VCTVLGIDVRAFRQQNGMAKNHAFREQNSVAKNDKNNLKIILNI